MEPKSEIVRVDRKGAVLGRFGPPANYQDVDVLADGMGLLVGRAESGELNGHLYVVDARGAYTRLNPGSPIDYASAVAPDSLVAFTYSPEGDSKDAYARPANGVGDARLLATSPNVKHPNSWSRDGQTRSADTAARVAELGSDDQEVRLTYSAVPPASTLGASLYR